jgi:hypothetical protein
VPGSNPNCSHFWLYAIHGSSEYSEAQLVSSGAETAAAAIMPINRMGRVVPPSATARVCQGSPPDTKRCRTSPCLGLARVLSERFTFSAYRSQLPIRGEASCARPILRAWLRNQSRRRRSSRQDASKAVWLGAVRQQNARVGEPTRAKSCSFFSVSLRVAWGGHTASLACSQAVQML